MTWDSVSNFMYCMEENVGGSSKAQEKWELIGPGRPMRSSKELWHQQPLERVRYSAELDKFFTAGR